MKQAKTLYIAYGSNLNTEQMAHRWPTATVVGTGTLNGYELSFKGHQGGAYATVGKRKGGIVPVLLWELEATDEQALDRYEGYPCFYRKEWVTVTVGGKPIKAMVYIMNERYQHCTPSKSYYETVKSGYEKAGFDYGVLEKALQASFKVYRMEG